MKYQQFQQKIVNEDVEHEAVEEVGPSTSANCASDQCFPEDNADPKEEDHTPHKKIRKISTENYLKVAK